MDTIKDPAFILGAVDTVAIIATAVYFNGQCKELKEELTKTSDSVVKITEWLKLMITDQKVMQAIQTNVGIHKGLHRGTDERLGTLEESVHNINDRLDSFAHTLESMASSMASQGFDIQVPTLSRHKKPKRRVALRLPHPSESDEDSQEEEQAAVYTAKQSSKGRKDYNARHHAESSDDDAVVSSASKHSSRGVSHTSISISEVEPRAYQRNSNSRDKPVHEEERKHKHAPEVTVINKGDTDDEDIGMVVSAAMRSGNRRE